MVIRNGSRAANSLRKNGAVNNNQINNRAKE